MDRFPFTASDIRTALARARETQASPRVIERLEWLLAFAESGGNASDTCRRFGIARTTFYRFASRFDPADLSTLEDRTHRPHTTRRSMISAEQVRMIHEYQKLYPEYGRKKIAESLFLVHGISLSEAMVGRIMRRERRNCPVAQPQPLAVSTSSNPVSAIEPLLTTAEPRPIGLRRISWAMLRRALLVTSVVGNLVLVGSLVATLLAESGKGREPAFPIHAAATELDGSGATIQVTHIVDGGDGKATALPGETLELIYRNIHSSDAH